MGSWSWEIGQDAAGGLVEQFDGEHEGLTVLTTLGISTLPAIPETRLMFEVMRESLWDLRSSDPFRVAAARRWIRADQPEWLFSFVTLCALFGLDADATRAKLLATSLPPKKRPRKCAA